MHVESPTLTMICGQQRNHDNILEIKINSLTDRYSELLRIEYTFRDASFSDSRDIDFALVLFSNLLERGTEIVVFVLLQVLDCWWDRWPRTQKERGAVDAGS